METKQPTQEQLKEFWEWCGFKQAKIKVFYTYPDGREGVLPLLDLNNLFKYAVPKLEDKHDIMLTVSDGIFLAEVTQKSPIILRLGRSKDPALALFWAIWEVIRGS